MFAMTFGAALVGVGLGAFPDETEWRWAWRPVELKHRRFIAASLTALGAAILAGALILGFLETYLWP